MRSLRTDTRAIEGLPVRLVIAIVVGVASLSVMMNTLGGVGTLAVTEVDAQPSPDVVAPGEREFTIRVVDADGNPVSGATVVLRSDTARLQEVHTATTNESGYAVMTAKPGLGQNQAEGTLEIDIKPPGGSEYADDRENTQILVVEE